VRLGALLHGELSWVAAGDEASDVDCLLGRQCVAHWELHDGAQMSLLDSERGKDPHAQPSPAANAMREAMQGMVGERTLGDGTKVTISVGDSARAGP
jgi:hypothetical protein